jgi:hypothetical protein
VSFTVASLIKQLTPDPWRVKVGFSQDITVANTRLFSSEISESTAFDVLGEWLQKNQPCVFGRIAAKLGFIRYCILTEEDLSLSDESIEQKIQQSRLQWIREGYNGRTSNFLILAISPTISFAVPDKIVAALAQRLCSLYLRMETQFDFIHHDHIFLEKPGPTRTTWRWLAGVNYFCSQGDKRWWNDHRIPGGMAFSVNSVGHFVKSEKVAHVMRELNDELGLDDEIWNDSKVDSLEKALVLAMQTISLASDATSGKARELLSVSNDRDGKKPECPIRLPTALFDKNHCEYAGYYHTDYTLPSEYFLPDVTRPESIERRLLDFTYLFHKHVDNPDHWTMGEGQRIRSDSQVPKTASDEDNVDYKRERAIAAAVPIESSDLLVDALSF